MFTGTKEFEITEQRERERKCHKANQDFLRRQKSTKTR